MFFVEQFYLCIEYLWKAVVVSAMVCELGKEVERWCGAELRTPGSAIKRGEMILLQLASFSALSAMSSHQLHHLKLMNTINSLKMNTAIKCHARQPVLQVTLGRTMETTVIHSNTRYDLVGKYLWVGFILYGSPSSTSQNTSLCRKLPTYK